METDDKRKERRIASDAIGMSSRLEADAWAKAFNRVISSAASSREVSHPLNPSAGPGAERHHCQHHTGGQYHRQALSYRLDHHLRPRRWAEPPGGEQPEQQ